MWFDWKVHCVNLHAGVQVEVLVPPRQLIVLHADWWVKGRLDKEDLAECNILMKHSMIQNRNMAQENI